RIKVNKSTYAPLRSKKGASNNGAQGGAPYASLTAQRLPCATSGVWLCPDSSWTHF
ncbi:hypothetical protein PanWU01x14_002420, partial [Parasponia andersonii]